MAQDTSRKDLIRYDLMVQDALRSVVRRVLTDAAKFGLPGEHYFYVTFRTRMPGVKLSGRMLQKYPEEMNIILQHQFWDLTVSDDHFEVGLSFGGVAEKLFVPFSSICGFYDPSVEFGLKFEVQGGDGEGQDAAPGSASAGNGQTPETQPGVTRIPSPKAAPARAQAQAEPVAIRAKPSLVRVEDAPSAPAKGHEPDAAKPAGKDTTKVVSIDAFRKKT